MVKIAYSLPRSTIIIFATLVIIVCALSAITTICAQRIEAAHPPRGRFVEIDGGRMHLVELGNTAAPPLVLLHGAMVNLGDMQLALGERLAVDHRVILFDRPGHGWSERPGGAVDASPARQAELLHQELQRIGVDHAVIVAHSWSGSVALAYALEYPGALSGLVLLAPVTHPRPQDVGWHQSVLTALLGYTGDALAGRVSGPLLAHTLALPVGESLLSLGLRSAFAPQQVPPNYLALSGTELTLRPSEIVANGEEIGSIDDFLIKQAPRYSTIRTPIRILVGDADQGLSLDIHAKALAKVLPQAKLMILPGVGHMVHYAAPESVIEAVDDLLGEVRQGTTSLVPQPECLSQTICEVRNSDAARQ